MGVIEWAVRSNDVFLLIKHRQTFLSGSKVCMCVGLTSTGTAVGGTGVYWGM